MKNIKLAITPETDGRVTPNISQRPPLQIVSSEPTDYAALAAQNAKRSYYGRDLPKGIDEFPGGLENFANSADQTPNPDFITICSPNPPVVQYFR